MKIIVEDHIPYLRGIVEHYGDVEYLSASQFTSSTIKEADILLVRTGVSIKADMLRGSCVKLICSATIGFDHIDTEYCDVNNILWRNAPGCNRKGVQQYIAASLIALSRQKNFSLKGKTIGIVGVGNVGSAVEVVCRALGMRVLLNDSPRQEAEQGKDFVDMDVICEAADIITFHTPLTKTGAYKTQYLGNTSFFAHLKKKPILINSARGGVVNTLAIKKAIEDGQITDAIVDCWENEPVIDKEYMNMASIATAHIAGYSMDGKANASRMILESVADFLKMDKAPITAIQEDEPEHPIIDLNGLGATETDRLHNAILSTYNPMVDDALLRNNATDFKRLRNEYLYRREFRGYTIINASSQEEGMYKLLDFKIGKA